MLLLVDNYDSFTYNLYQYLGELGAEVRVVRNDEASVDELLALMPERIVLSPGPGNPDQAGVCLGLIARLAEEKRVLPLLGVCLGHQAIGQAFGGKVVRADEVMHGKTSLIRHEGAGIFRALPNPLEATRYHSLIVERATLPPSLAVIAEGPKGEIMGLGHRSLPIWGVQFHPESILTKEGKRLLGNFLSMSAE